MVTIKIDPPQPLPPKLEAVLIRLAKNKPINMTHAVKLPYLVDVVANHVLGRPITEGHHEAWKYGVVTSEAWRYLSRAEDDPGSAFHVEEIPFSEEKRITAGEAVADDALSEDERRIVDYIASEYASAWAMSLGSMTKRMNPEMATWGNNHPADIGSDAYDRMSADYQEMAAWVAAWPLDRLRRSWHPVEDIEDVIA
jgi:uncharacterized phage-associated protein